ncbi:MAG: flagellar biosynthesis protein FlhF [Clostridia bacterium]|nr:flagellar biosynthesis protein FlhF [Clostridia bacterium]
MRIKRYLVNNMQEAYLAIRRDLGPEAVIVSSRQVRQPGWRGFFLPRRLEVTAAVDTVGQKETPAEEGLRRELAEIKAVLKQLSLPAVNNSKDALQAWRSQLLGQELLPELVDKLLEGLENASSEVLGQVIKARLAGVVTPAPSSFPERKTTLAFIGPTGVGKTTTLAKLAARFSLFGRRRAGILTLDTYRIGAVDQLKIYAEIMGLPLEVAMTPRDVKQALEKLAGCEVLLVDTAGRPSGNVSQLAETKGFLDLIQPEITFLVLSCTTRWRDVRKVLEDFRRIGYNQLIFTKIDETTCPGLILSAAYTTGLPVAYVTNGQNVPDDLMETDPYQLADLIWKAVDADGSGGQAS